MAELAQSMPWLWSILVLTCGTIVGAVWASGWRTRLSNDLLSSQQLLRVAETKAEHQRFGIADLKIRIRQSDNQTELMRADLKLLRSTYDRLNDELQARWDSNVVLKTRTTEHQQEVDGLQEQLSELKDEVAQLQNQLDEGLITEVMLKKELTAGLTALCEHTGDTMPAVQQILLDSNTEIDSANPQRVLGLLGAKVQLLEGQVRYWQDQATESEQPADSNDALQLFSADSADLNTQVIDLTQPELEPDVRSKPSSRRGRRKAKRTRNSKKAKAVETKRA